MGHYIMYNGHEAYREFICIFYNELTKNNKKATLNNIANTLEMLVNCEVNSSDSDRNTLYRTEHFYRLKNAIASTVNDKADELKKSGKAKGKQLTFIKIHGELFKRLWYTEITDNTGRLNYTQLINILRKYSKVTGSITLPAQGIMVRYLQEFA